MNNRSAIRFIAFVTVASLLMADHYAYTYYTAFICFEAKTKGYHLTACEKEAP